MTLSLLLIPFIEEVTEKQHYVESLDKVPIVPLTGQTGWYLLKVFYVLGYSESEFFLIYIRFF